ncbi:hypothetical protein KFL_001310010 [Klebsormidium nitens]|uniref:Transmembrane protein n=1 Tax=Klebsormidium nitens TaxID=105231 RepID=A0A1Y1I0K3_KLENI|nr:hypothetical protein KFL_001310010 [Klebsormidium nitens]|eukprot:GAQ82969.1 hypothetical protein KFL_001310010 [Klebsormidium nitens]
MGSTTEKGGGSKDQRGTDGQKGGRKARRRLAPVRLILIVGAAVLTCGALWNHAMLDFHTAEGLINQPHGLHHRRSLLSMAASRGSSSGGLPITSKEGLSTGAVSGDPQHERKEGRGSKYMPLKVVEGELSSPAVNAGNVLGRLLDHKLRGQRPAERQGAKRGESPGGVLEDESASEVEREIGDEQALPAVSGADLVRQSASVEQKAGADAAVDDLGGVKEEIVLGKTGEASANVRGPGARTGLLSRQGVLSKLSSFLAGSPRIRQAGGSQADVSTVAAPGLRNQTAQKDMTVQSKPSVVLHNLRNARGGARETSDSELRLIEEARRALGEPGPAGGAETGAMSGGKNEDILESADDRWDLMRIENKLKAEQEYAAYMGNLEDEKARAEAAEATRLKAEADGAGKDKQNGNADGRNGLAEERNGLAEERNEAAEERKEDAGLGGIGAGDGNGEEAGAKGEAEGGEKEAVETDDKSKEADGDKPMELDGEQGAALSGGQEAESKSEGGGEELEVVTDSEAKDRDGIKSEEMTTEEGVDGNDGASSAGEKAEDEGTWEAGLAAAVELESPVKIQGADGAATDTPFERDASEEGEGKAAE